MSPAYFRGASTRRARPRRWRGAATPRSIDGLAGTAASASEASTASATWASRIRILSAEGCGHFLTRRRCNLERNRRDVQRRLRAGGSHATCVTLASQLYLSGPRHRTIAAGAHMHRAYLPVCAAQRVSQSLLTHDASTHTRPEGLSAGEAHVRACANRLGLQPWPLRLCLLLPPPSRDPRRRQNQIHVPDTFR